MKNKENWKRRHRNMLVVVRAGTSTWAVAFSRRLIPGALFKTQEGAIGYALAITRAAGLSCANIIVVGPA